MSTCQHFKTTFKHNLTCIFLSLRAKLKKTLCPRTPCTHGLFSVKTMTGSKDEVNVGFRSGQLAQTRIYDVGFRQRIVDLKTSDKKKFIFIMN